MSALEIAAAVRSGERSAVDVIDEHLGRPAGRIAAIAAYGSASARPTDRICRDDIAWRAGIRLAQIECRCAAKSIAAIATNIPRVAG